MKKLFNKLPFKKFIAVFTSITFIFTGVFGNSAFASVGTSMPSIDTIKFDNPIIPLSLGKITSAKYFDSEDIIIDIQDLHCHAETQRKIASIIGYIDNEYNISNVYLEGAFKTVDTSWLSAFNNNQNGTKVLEGLIDSGKLSGTEYYSIMNNKKNFVLGIEKEELYKENIKLLGAILSLQPEINAICSQLEKEIGKVKRDYSGKQARKLQRLIKSFKEKEIDAKHFYSQLKVLADSVNISIDKYPNIKTYIFLLDKAQYVNDKKVVYEFAKFVSELKNILPYQQYSDLLKRSNNFTNFEDVSSDLIALNKKYGIAEKLKLESFKNFLAYLDFNQNINPIKLVQEEETFINELYVKLGRTKYEKEVAFLADFIPTIKQYFTADISADEYYKFDKNYENFKIIWPSYFSENILKNLDQYQRLLAKYHKNNIVRDQIFADRLISQKNINNKTAVNDTTSAVKQIKSNLGTKKIKVVVTGGFHTRGLERIFEQQRISYIIITPKITQPVEQAKQIYIDNVMYYSNILKNTINLEPLTQEPLNVSFPKILNLIFSEVQKNTIFEDYSKEQLSDGIKNFVQEYIIAKQSGFYGNVEILNWDIISIDSKGKTEFYVEYKDNANKGMVSNIRYRFIDGEIIPYSSVDTSRTKQMLERITTNKYAQPSIELEPTNATRKKIAKHILEPLQKVAGDSVKLMPFGQLHMTIGYDSTPFSQSEQDKLAEENNSSDDIFTVLDNLGEDFVNFRTSMAGTLKLMPDGVIIYEITDKDLIEHMLGFRTTLKNIDSKYRTPSIVHMSIGRIFDMKLLDGSEQSKQELAELLEKINETIYEINKKKALSKVKTTFTLKSGYVSSTGDKDFAFRRLLPKKESLVVFKNLVDSSKTKLSFAYKVIVAPLIEEFLFRFVPFFVTGLFVSSPVSIVPVIVTGIIGILGFSFAHPLADKINNFINKEINDGKITNSFISKLFSGDLTIRNVRDFLIPSTILTAVFVTFSFIFPQSIFAAFIITSLLHSINNFIVLKTRNGLLLNIKQISSSQENNLNSEINQIIETLKGFTKNRSLPYEKERDAFINDFENIGEDKGAIAQKVIELFDFVIKNHKKSSSFDLTYLLEPLLNISVYLNDEQGKLLFDGFFNAVFNEASDKKNGSSRYFEMLMNSAQYFYKTGQTEYVHKIFDTLYRNKSGVTNMTDYKKFALSVPSPFSFDKVEDWEREITTIMKEDSSFATWFMPMLEVLLSSPSGKVDKYAKAYIKALYDSGKQTTPPTLDSGKTNYEWVKEFYNACGAYNEYFNLDPGIVLAEDKVSKQKISLSDLISKLGYLKLQKTDIPYIQSDKFYSVIQALTNALSLSKKEQLNVLREQISTLYTDLFENQKINSEVFEILAPVLGALIKEGTTTFLEDLCNKLFERGMADTKMDFGFAEIAHIYTVNKEKGLALIAKKFEESAHTYNPLYVQLYGNNWKIFSPKTIEEARQNVPKELQKVIFEYSDLEAYYNAIGLSFDILNEPSELFDRDMYVPEYQPLFSFVPKDILDFKNITKYFRTLKSEQIKHLDVSEEQESALNRLLKNGNLALAKVSNSVEDLKEAVEYIGKMLQDFKLISSDKDTIKNLEEKLADIKRKIEEGKIEDILTREAAWWTNDNGIYGLISDINQKAISKTRNISDKFEAFERILENNELALSSLTKMNEDSIKDTIYFIEEMLDAFEIIEPKMAQRAKISLLRIKENVEKRKVKFETLARLNPWTEDGLDEINELHTLINAVHQTSTSKLMSMVGSSSDIGGRKVILRQDGTDQISFYDCSEGFIKDEMKEFLVTLAEINKTYDGQWVIKDNKLLYSKQLGFHGVNILVDMEEGIRVTFNESGRGDGNALRTTLLATLFAQAGFDITYVDTLVTESSTVGGPCKFTAVYNLNKDSTTPEKYAFWFSQALEILSNTKDVDYALEDDNETENDHYHGAYYIPKLTIEDYRKMKNTFDMPEEFKKGKTGALVGYWTARIERVKKLRNAFDKSKQEEREEFSALYKYLGMDSSESSPWKIVHDYIKGKLIINNGVLEKNKEYDGINILLDAIEGNVDDSLRQAQVVNLLDYDSLNFETEGYIGGMVALSGLVRLDGKGWLSVKTAVDKERKRSKFAYVEFVDFKGNRKKLNYKELIQILQEFGYAVKEQKPRSHSEKKESLTVLREKILYPKDGIYTRGMSVSGQSDKYVPVTITYDKDKVNENSMWVVSFTSPEDVPSIIKAGAIMTTTGGMLSHANITARENNKTAILSNGQWVDGKLVVPYYSIESPIEQRRGYEIQKIAEQSLVLEEGTVVLANGINGRVLVYNDIPKETIADLQKAIDDDNLSFIMEYIQNHYEDSNIRQVVEYIFLQVITDKDKQDITQFLLAWDHNSDIGKKIEELVKVYTGEKIKALKIYVENERKIEDANIRLAVLNFIQQELDVLDYSLIDDTIVEGKQGLVEAVREDRNVVLSQRDKEVKNIIRKVNEILSKTDITEQDKDELVKISERAKVWHNYGNSEVEDLVAKIDKIISSEIGIDYETEIRDFKDIRAKDVVRYGTKTTELAKLARLFKEKEISVAGIPDGIGISKDVLRIFFERNGLGEKYLQLMKDFKQAIKSKNKERAKQIGNEISQLIDSIDDEQLEEYLKSKLDDGKKYAVRSSGVGEDGANHAFAGMAKTELNVNKDEVYSKVKEGWKSFFTDTCIEDMVKVGIVVQPALLIQEMVVGVKKAGVIFTRDNSGNLTVEGVLGLGEGLVSGRISPDHITVRSSDGRIEYRRALNNKIKIEEKTQGGTRVTKISDEEKIERILDEDTIRQLQEIAKILEEDAGYPVDIEFAIDENGKIFVLQRRAITTFTTQEKTQTAAVPVIEQALIDKTIKLLSYWESDIKEIKDVIKQLSDLPEDKIERYNTIVKEIYHLLDILKEAHRLVIRPGSSSSYIKSKNIYDTNDEFGKFCIENDITDSLWDNRVYFSDFIACLLLPFFNISDIKNEGKPLFNSIVDYWLIEKESRGGVVVGEMATLMRFVYSMNSDFLPYIVSRLTKYKHISPEEPIHRDIKDGLKKYYDVLKEYYFAVSSQEKINETLSKELKNIVDNLNTKITPLITDGERQEKLKLTLSRIEELSARVNSKNMALLQTLVNDLWEIISKEDKQNKEKAVVYMLPLFVCLAKSGANLEGDRTFESQMNTIVDIFRNSYDVNSDNKLFKDVLDGLIGISKQFYNQNNKNSAKICDYIIKTVLLTVYAPISIGTLDKNSSEYRERERTFYDVFDKLNSELPNNLGIFSYLFAENVVRNPEAKSRSWFDDDDEEDENAYIYGPGLNIKTLRMYINTISKSHRRNVEIPIPKRDSDIRDIDELADLFVNNYDFFNLSTICNGLFNKEEDGNAQKLAVAIIKKLFKEVESEDIGFKEKQKKLFTLIDMATSNLYMSAQKHNFFDIERLNDLCIKCNLPYYLKSVADSYVEFEDKGSTRGEYKLIRLLKYLPKNIFNFISGIVQEPPILYTINGETKNNDERVELIRNRFNTLRQILDDNTLALSLLGGLSKSKTPEKNMKELIDALSEMIKGLTLINEKHGLAAQIALDNIVKDLYSQGSSRISSLDLRRIERQVAIKQWNEDKLSEITELHTLINAVHQTSISDFKDTIEDITGSKSIKTIIATHQNFKDGSDSLEQTGAQIYDLSENKLNPDIVDFIGRLSQMHLPYPRAFDSEYQVNDFICMDNFLVWTTRLYVHSVDVFMNFAESDKTITISYHEGSRSFGNAQRVKYFSTVLEKLGFSVEADTKEFGDGVCGLKASLSSNYELSNNADFIDIATKVVSLFKYSDMLDFDLFDYGDDEGERSVGSGYPELFNNFVEKFMLGDIWFKYSPNDKKGWGGDLISLPKRKSLSGKTEKLKDILRYLGLPEDLPSGNVTQNDLNKYFNAVIERAFAVGRIILDKAGNLIKNENYDIVSYLAREISLNEKESINESRLINLIPRNEFKFKTVGYIGDLVAVSGYLKLEDGNYLSVKGLVNPVTKRMKYAVTELVTPIRRQKLTSDGLIKVLRRQGYDIPEQEWVSSRERKRIKNMLSRQVQSVQSPKIPSTPTSDGRGISIVGNITFDKSKVDEHSILVVPYTTPDDIQLIETAKGIITTGGGVLSHAAITTSELKKPSVVLNDATWINQGKEMEILYYLASGEPETINNQFQVQKVEETRKILKEGARVLMNGETGMVLLFDDIDISLLDELQGYIDADDAQAVIDFMNKHSQDENINRFVEYVYFQVVGNSKTIQTLDCLFSDDMPETVQDKVKKLNDSYIQDKVQSISEAITNIRTIENINIAYMILQKLNKKLNFIKTVGTRPEIEALKEQLKYMEKGIKEKLNVYMQSFINDATDLLSKDKLSSVDVQKIITMLKNIEIYNYFISDNETEKNLLSKKDTLQILVPMMRDKVNGYAEQKEEINLQEEISLFEENASDEKLFGSKTSQLAKMYKLLERIKGVIVPGGIGISVNVMPMLFKTLGKEELLTEFENAIRNKNKQKAMELAEEICDVIDFEELKGTELEKEIIKYLKKFIKPGQRYSVRSSGVGEDAVNNAFAGMGATKLNVGYDDIYDNVRECLKSFFSERCIDYMISSGQVVKPAVLVEEMVDSEISGVIFSREKYGNGRINTLFGQGEGLVSGMFTPDSVLFDMGTGEIIEYSVADKQFKLVTNVEGGTKKVSVGPNAKTRALNAKNVKKLAEIISILENSAGYPIDVEFAIKGDEIYILQMRPITTLDNKDNAEEEITGEQIREALHAQEIPSAQTRYEIYVTVGEVPKGQEPFAYIANPLDPTQSIPVYKKSADAQVTEFVVDPKFASVVKDGSLGRALMTRINTDPVMLAKLNDGIFNYKPGEIGLLPILDEDMLEKALSDNAFEDGMKNIRNILASA